MVNRSSTVELEGSAQPISPFHQRPFGFSWSTIDVRKLCILAEFIKVMVESQSQGVEDDESN